jgi:hypothetical protein
LWAASWRATFLQNRPQDDFVCKLPACDNLPEVLADVQLLARPQRARRHPEPARYVLVGRRDDARKLFERLLSLRNDLGLLSEEYDPAAKRLLGNFPQAFSHIALINTAHNIARPVKPCEQRSGHLSLPEAAE